MSTTEFIVTRTANNWPDSRYRITGGPPLVRGNSFNPVPWVAWSWTIRGAKRKISQRRAFLARVDKVVYREAA
jgi:hypothetical protein